MAKVKLFIYHQDGLKISGTYSTNDFSQGEIDNIKSIAIKIMELGEQRKK